MKALVGAFNQEKALVGAFSVIVQPVVEPVDRFTALVRDCVFSGGGGILIAEEAFYRSLLELEFENPELLSGSGSGMSDRCLRLFVDFCIFSDVKQNCCVFANNQATVIVSNSLLYGCGRSGLSAGEGSSLSVINCEVELETKVIRRFPKTLQSRRRP